MGGKRKRPIKETLKIIGEGQADAAFLKHLKSLYGVGNPKVSAKSAGGKGPDNVIGDAIGTLNSSCYDRVAALLDTDIPWPKSKVKKAQQKKIILVGSRPCLEGLLLKILEKPVPVSSDDCKKAFHPLLGGKETEKVSYEKPLPKTLLDARRDDVEELDTLIKLISGKKK